MLLKWKLCICSIIVTVLHILTTQLILIQEFWDDLFDQFDQCHFINTYVNNYMSDINYQETIYMKSSGRLGNAIFNYASLYGIAKQANRTAVLVKDVTFVTIKFRILFPCLTLPLHWFYPIHFTNINEVQSNAFDKTFLQPFVEQNICCSFESWKYFYPKYAEQLRQELTLSSQVAQKSSLYLQKLINKWYNQQKLHYAGINNFTLVGVHVRRGDKVYNNRGYNLPDITYFKTAASYFKNKFVHVLFIVTSDDISWCKDNFKFQDFVFSVSNSEIMDMALLSQCNHTIMSVGTFGWWGGWLAGGEVVYYKDHIKPGSHLSLEYKDEDYFLPDWTPMS